MELVRKQTYITPAQDRAVKRRRHTEFCVMAKSEKVLKSVQT